MDPCLFLRGMKDINNGSIQNQHIEFDLPLRATMIFPLSHTVQSIVSNTPMKITVSFQLAREIGKVWRRRRRAWEAFREWDVRLDDSVEKGEK